MVNLGIRSRAEKWCFGRSLKTSNQLSAVSQSAARLLGFATLCRLGLGLGLGLGGPWVAQGPPKRGAREAQGSIEISALFATRVGKRPGGVARKARLSPKSPRSESTKTFNHEKDTKVRQKGTPKTGPKSGIRRSGNPGRLTTTSAAPRNPQRPHGSIPVLHCPGGLQSR